MPQGTPGTIKNKFLKTARAKRAGGVAQVVECLPCKCKALSSNPSTAKKQTKKQNPFLSF
jgi:hypothetical protein